MTFNLICSLRGHGHEHRPYKGFWCPRCGQKVAYSGYGLWEPLTVVERREEKAAAKSGSPLTRGDTQ